MYDDEEEKFYTWDEIEKELSELEFKYGDSDEIVKSLVTPSVSSYWKRKLEEEKLLHQKILETKEEEKKQIQLKLQQQEEIIKELKQQIEKLERGEYEKLYKAKEELRLKELELAKEKEKLIWQQQIQGLEFDKKLIEEKVTSIKKEFEKEKQELLIYYNHQFDTLLDVQRNLVEETNRLEKELERIVSAANAEIATVKKSNEELLSQLNEAKNFVEQIKLEKTVILQEKKVLEETIESLRKEHLIDKRRLVDSIATIVKNNVSEIRSIAGLIIGAVNFCERYHKSKSVVKFHYNLILNTVQRIFAILDELVKSIIEITV